MRVAFHIVSIPFMSVSANVVSLLDDNDNLTMTMTSHVTLSGISDKHKLFVNQIV